MAPPTLGLLSHQPAHLTPAPRWVPGCQAHLSSQPGRACTFFIKCQRVCLQDGCSKSRRQAGSNSKRSLSPALELESQTQAWAGLGLLRPLPDRADGGSSPPTSSQGRPSECMRVLTSSCKDPGPGGLGLTLVVSLYLVA